MSYIPNFKNDIFISYAHIDNQPLIEGKKGWISNFHRILEILLQQRVGPEIKIWRDPKLQGNDYLSEDTIKGQIQQTAVLVAILSPCYIKSKWCLLELREFLGSAEKNYGIKINNKSRLFKVVKTYVPREEHPPELKDLLGYEFFEKDPTTDQIREYIQEIGSNLDQNYWFKLYDLADHIKKLLVNFKNIQESAPPLTSSTSKTIIYLAETTLDLIESRDKIKRDLQQRDYDIIPDKDLPYKNVEVFKNEVQSYLERCKLSIHMIGENYGTIPEGETQSIVSLQVNLAIELYNKFKFLPVIWMQKDLAVKEERQKKFIEELKNNSRIQETAEIFETTLEDLKTNIQDKLYNGVKRKTKFKGKEGQINVYLICDQRDLDTISSLCEYLHKKGYNVFLPAFEGDEPTIREDHKTKCLFCDAILIYYGNANDSWLYSNLFLIKKAPGYGREKPFLATAIYLAPPSTKPKKHIIFHDPLVLGNCNKFYPDVLQPFLLKIEKGKGGYLI